MTMKKTLSISLFLCVLTLASCKTNDPDAVAVKSTGDVAYHDMNKEQQVRTATLAGKMLQMCIEGSKGNTDDCYKKFGDPSKISVETISYEKTSK